MRKDNKDLLQYSRLLYLIHETTGYDQQIIHEILKVTELIVNEYLKQGKGIKLHDNTVITHSLMRNGKYNSQVIVYKPKKYKVTDYFKNVNLKKE